MPIGSMLQCELRQEAGKIFYFFGDGVFLCQIG
jgi:hypothetical protein